MEELELLFQFVPPSKLRKRIDFLFYNYIMDNSTDDLPEDFQEISEDVYFLIRFLEKARKDKFPTPETQN